MQLIQSGTFGPFFTSTPAYCSSVYFSLIHLSSCVVIQLRWRTLPVQRKSTLSCSKRKRLLELISLLLLPMICLSFLVLAYQCGYVLITETEGDSASQDFCDGKRVGGEAKCD